MAPGTVFSVKGILNGKLAAVLVFSKNQGAKLRTFWLKTSVLRTFIFDL